MNTFGRILEKYGETISIHKGEESIAAKAFIQPVLKSGGDRMTHLGRVNDGEFYFFAPAYLELGDAHGITVTDASGEYDLIKAERYRAMGKNSHWECILKRRY